MKLKIAFYNEKISWNKDWVFLGSSFMKLQSVEKKIIGPRIKINKFLHEIFNNELQNYLEWTAEWTAVGVLTLESIESMESIEVFRKRKKDKHPFSPFLFSFLNILCFLKG